MGQRYRGSDRKGKVRILDELVAITGYNREYATRVLGVHGRSEPSGTIPQRGRIHGEALKEALTLIWEAADRICSKRLKAAIPVFVVSMERHGHLSLDPVVREKLLNVSVSTIDRLLQPVRTTGKGSRKRKRGPSAVLKRQIPVRTFSDWDNEPPGFCEVDFVAHDGGISAGACVHTLVVTDVYSGWTECLALVARQKSLVVQGLEVLGVQLPFPLLGLDFDNDGAFMNEDVFDYCRAQEVCITRSRPYRKNDQAWIEQKNGSVVRRLVGYSRLVGLVAAHTLGRLYKLSRLYVNFFQPSFKLRSKTRHGAKVIKRYFEPATPCDRLLECTRVSDTVKGSLRQQRRSLDPVRLLRGIRELQGTLYALARQPGSDQREIPASQSLDAFLAVLPRMWRDGEVRPTHRRKPSTPRTWRTREDPFGDVWPKVLGWLQDEPESAAKDLFERLLIEHPGRFKPGQLRTLQRRVRDWRQAMARELIYAGTGEPTLDSTLPSPTATLSGYIS